MPDPRSTIQAIQAGDYDGQLGDLIAAILARAAISEISFPWKITLDGDEWTQETVTLSELAYAERVTGTRYIDLDPVRSADHLVALVVAHLKVVRGLRVDEAIKHAEQLTVADLADLVSVYEVNRAPKDESELSTTS
jgi:hypothetical protein